MNDIFEKHKQALVYLLKICKAEGGLEFAHKWNPFDEDEKEKVIIKFRLFYIMLPAIDTSINPLQFAGSIEEEFKEFIDNVEKELEKRNLRKKRIDINTAITEGARQLCLVVSPP